MKLSSLLLAGSLLANAIFLAGLALRPSLAPPAVRDFIVRHTPFSSSTPEVSVRTRTAGAAVRNTILQPPARLLGPAFETW